MWSILWRLQLVDYHEIIWKVKRSRFFGEFLRSTGHLFHVPLSTLNPQMAQSLASQVSHWSRDCWIVLLRSRITTSCQSVEESKTIKQLTSRVCTTLGSRHRCTRETSCPWAPIGQYPVSACYWKKEKKKKKLNFKENTFFWDTSSVVVLTFLSETMKEFDGSRNSEGEIAVWMGARVVSSTSFLFILSKKKGSVCGLSTPWSVRTTPVLL